MAGKVFSDFIKSVKDYGFVRIIPLLTIDNIIASSILMKMFMENDVAVSISFKPLVETDAPSLVIDIPLDSLSCGNICLNIVYDDTLKSIEVKGNNLIITPHSISATIVKIIEDLWILSGFEKIVCLIGGIDRGKDLSKEGFTCLEKEIAEELSRSNKIFYDIVGFRLWGWKRRKLYEILVYTFKPFIPGLSGRKEEVLDFIRKLGFNRPEEVHSSDLMANEDTLKNFATELLKLANEKSRRRRNPIEFISRIYYIPRGADFIDLMELYGAMLTAFSRSGDFLLNNLLIAHDQYLVDKLILFYEKNIGAISSEIADAIDNIYVEKGNRIVIESVIVNRPEIYEFILKEIGFIDKNSYIVLEKNGRQFTSLYSLLKTGRKPKLEEFNEEQIIYLD